MNKKQIVCFKSIVYILFFFLEVGNITAQISEGGIPPCFNYPNVLKSSLQAIEVPINFCVEDMKAVDAWQVSQGAPLRISKLIDVNINLEKDGNPVTLPDGQQIIQLRIRANNAIALMLYYSEFYIPEGGKLFIYNTDKTQLLGAYTSITNPPTKSFATEFVAGDDLILEYVPSVQSNEQPRICIESVGYGYNHLSVNTATAATRSNVNSCMVNINCEEGDAWQTEKKGVCRMVMKIGDSGYLCSASLVNNTNEDLTPYILSAFHCTVSESGKPASKDDYNQWVFHFGYERTQCSDESIAYLSKTMIGCAKVASIPIKSGSDGLLLKLNQSIPQNYNVYYNGWDRTDTPAQSGVGIHHPNGDYKKISTYHSPTTTTIWSEGAGENQTLGYKNAHWNVIFDVTTNGHSVTAGGSSGSPLFNQNKQIVGTLTGGNSECGTNENGSNLYGKLFYHWNKFPQADSTRMDIWLDPAKTGVTQLAGRYATPDKPNPTDLTLTYKNSTVSLTWKAPAANIQKYAIYRNNVFVNYATTTTYKDNATEPGSQTYGVSAIFNNGEESATTNATILVPDYKAPTNVAAKTASDNSVLINWKAPIYQQTIYWGTGKSNMLVGFKGIPFYFGQVWNTDDLKYFHKKKLTAIQFVPMAGTYSILIFQGNMVNKYTQKITNPVNNEMNTISLQTPYVIDANKDLFVTIYAESYKETEYPGVVDAGPVVNGKGNIISMDGYKWEIVAPEEGEDSTSYDFNFIVGAIVTSEEGNISTQRSLNGELALNKTSVSSSLRSAKTTFSTELRSSQPTAFPEITGYNVYRKDSKLTTIPAKETQYTDNKVPAGRYKYYVSTMYEKDEESALSEAISEVVVGIEDIDNNAAGITPLLFDEQIRIKNVQDVNMLEILTVDGKTIQQIKSPEEIINTASLATGIYIFKLHTTERIIVIQAAKQK